LGKKHRTPGRKKKKPKGRNHFPFEEHSGQKGWGGNRWKMWVPVVQAGGGGFNRKKKPRKKPGKNAAYTLLTGFNQVKGGGKTKKMKYGMRGKESKNGEGVGGGRGSRSTSTRQ